MAQSRKSLVRERLKHGLKELERGRPAPARQALEQAVELDPGNDLAQAYLGTALLQLGDSGGAVRRLERAAQGLPNEAWVAGNLAEAYFRANRFESAERSFATANRLDPQNPNFRLGIANSLASQQRFDAASTALEELLRLDPSNPLVWYNLGNVRRDQQRLDDAVRCFRSALDAAPDWIDARNSLGSALHALFRFDEAEQAYRACFEAQPDRHEYGLNLASVLIDSGHPAQAEVICQRLVEARPDSSTGRAFLSAALMQQGKLLQALEHDRVSATLTPDDPASIENYACALAHVGRYEAAWPQFERAAALRRDAAVTRHMRSNALLSCGRLADGWRDYLSRMPDDQFAERFPLRRRLSSLPDVASLRAGAEVALISEQGLGDELFLLRFARALGALGARIRYRSSEKLLGLLHSAEPVAAFLDNDALDRETPVMPVGDLPHALYAAGIMTGSDPASPEEYPAPIRLTASAERIEAMRLRLRSAGPPPYIAVTWTGGVPPKDQRRDWTLHKTIDTTGFASALRGLPGTLVSVQRIPVAADAQAFARASGKPMHDYSDLNDALDDMLALLTLVDEYIGVSNTNMHMRAGAGRTARVLIPAPAEWRWPGAGPHSPWFPGFTCYRQGLDGDWTRALEALKADLSTALVGR